MESCDAGEGLGLIGTAARPVRLWARTHSNGWETWAAELSDGTFASWACPDNQNASSISIEDCFEHASAAAVFDLNRLSGDAICDVACASWAERDVIATCE